MKKKKLGPGSEAQLTRGRIRKLTNSESNRGYLFITNAKYRNNFIDEHDFTVIFDGYEIPHRALDDFGRAIVSREFIRKYKSGLTIQIRLIRRDKVEVKIVN